MNARRRRPERLVALFITVFWFTVVFAIDGLLAILLDRDPIPEGIGPYYAVLAFLFAGLVLWLLLSETSRSRNPTFGAIGAAASIYLVFLLVALPFGFSLVAEQALSPFVLAATMLAAAVVVGTWLALRSLRWRRSSPS
ncbi:hypothetical protein BH11ACT3_BH11ACT3_12580 [soil metagenome]